MSASPGPRQKPGIRRLAVRLLALAFSLLAGVGLLELGVRCLVDVTDIRPRFWDPAVGPRIVPDLEGRYVRGPDINVPFHFNAQGWNHPDDYETTRAPGTRRVCIVGDSYVEALQVPYEQSMFGLAAARMTRPDRPVQWYAFGQSGWGTSHAHLVIRHYVLDYQPDVVVLFFTQNDPIDCSPYLATQESHTPHFSLDDTDGLLMTPARRFRPRMLRRALYASALVRYFRLQRGFFQPRVAPEDRARIFLRETVAASGSKAASGADHDAIRERQARTWQLVEALLKRTKEGCDARGVVFALAYRGSRAEIAAAEQGETFAPAVKQTDPFCLGERIDEMGRDWLAPITHRLGIPYLDLTPAIVARVKQTGKRHDFTHDEHYGPIAHEAAADAMADWIESLWTGDAPPP